MEKNKSRRAFLKKSFTTLALVPGFTVLGKGSASDLNLSPPENNFLPFSKMEFYPVINFQFAVKNTLNEKNSNKIVFDNFPGKNMSIAIDSLAYSILELCNCGYSVDEIIKICGEGAMTKKDVTGYLKLFLAYDIIRLNCAVKKNEKPEDFRNSIYSEIKRQSGRKSNGTVINLSNGKTCITVNPDKCKRVPYEEKTFLCYEVCPQICVDPANPPLYLEDYGVLIFPDYCIFCCECARVCPEQAIVCGDCE